MIRPDGRGLAAVGAGLNSKVMALVDRNGRLAKFAVVPGNAAENLQLPALLDGITTGEVIADKAYDSNAIRQMLAGQNIVATIPSKLNRTIPIWLVYSGGLDIYALPGDERCLG